MNTGLSKGLYIRGLQCSKSLWLHKHKPELKDSATNKQTAAFGAGVDVGELACQLFPDGIMVPYDGLSISEQVKKTSEAIAAGHDVIYEASFVHDGIFIKVDILRRSESGWLAYEVKASTQVKAVHKDDVALQLYVLRGAGIDVSRIYLTHINNTYLRKDLLDIDKLFCHVDLTEVANEKFDFVEKNISALRQLLEQSVPDVKIGKHCSNPYDCDFKGHCYKDVPKDSVLTLRSRGIDKFKYFHDGFERFEDLPLDKLNRMQRMQVELHLSQGEHLQKEKIQEFLGGLWYPLVHLDFETYMSAIPIYPGTRPYQQVPFQYSMHIQHEADGPIVHHEYLAEPNIDPRPDLINGMLEHIPEGACVLTYNMKFEKGRIKELEKDFPEHADRLVKIRDNVRDLIVPFKKRYAYRWPQKGSASIKKVLPAFVPDVSYEGMEIADGGMAMEAYHIMCAENDSERLEKLRKNLLSYCRLDTEAMVLLLDRLDELAT